MTLFHTKKGYNFSIEWDLDAECMFKKHVHIVLRNALAIIHWPFELDWIPTRFNIFNIKNANK